MIWSTEELEAEELVGEVEEEASDGGRDVEADEEEGDGADEERRNQRKAQTQPPTYPLILYII